MFPQKWKCKDTVFLCIFHLLSSVCLVHSLLYSCNCIDIYIYIHKYRYTHTYIYTHVYLYNIRMHTIGVLDLFSLFGMMVSIFWQGWHRMRDRWHVRDRVTWILERKNYIISISYLYHIYIISIPSHFFSFYIIWIPLFCNGKRKNVIWIPGLMLNMDPRPRIHLNWRSMEATFCESCGVKCKMCHSDMMTVCWRTLQRAIWAARKIS